MESKTPDAFDVVGSPTQCIAMQSTIHYLTQTYYTFNQSNTN
jgi:hypothetical protein